MAEVVASDNCGGPDPDVELSWTDHDTTSTCVGSFSFTRTFTATAIDNCGNETTVSCSQSIGVADQTDRAAGVLRAEHARDLVEPARDLAEVLGVAVSVQQREAHRALAPWTPHVERRNVVAGRRCLEPDEARVLPQGAVSPHAVLDGLVARSGEVRVAWWVRKGKRRDHGGY